MQSCCGDGSCGGTTDEEEEEEDEESAPDSISEIGLSLPPPPPWRACHRRVDD